MKRLSIIFLVFTAILLFYCSKQKKSDKNNSDSIIPINLSIQGSLNSFNLNDLKKTSIIKSSDIGIESIQYVPLGHNSGSLISYINKIDFDSTSIYISSYNDIKKFDYNGRFISYIGKKGRGPTEFPFINDFSVGYNSNIYVLATDYKKILEFTNTGKFIKTIPLQFIATELSCFKEGIVCYCKDRGGTVKNSFQIIDYNGNIIRQIPNKYKYPDRISYVNGEIVSFNKCSDKIYFKEQLSDTVFSFDGKNINLELVIDRGGKLITRELLSTAIHFPSPEKVLANYVIDLKQTQNKNYLYLIFQEAKSYYAFFASLNDSTGYLMNLKKHGIVNDYDSGPNIDFKASLNDNTFIGWIDAHELKAHVASDEFKNSTPLYPEKKKELEQLANSLEVNDNPVLMLVKLKE